MSSTPSTFGWTPSLKRKVVGLHLGFLVAAALFWSSGAWLGGGYRLELADALIVAAVPGLPFRYLSIWLATLWIRRAAGGGSADSFKSFTSADVIVTLALGLVAMPTILVAYSVFAAIAWTLLVPLAPLATGWFLLKQGFLARPEEDAAGSGDEPKPESSDSGPEVKAKSKGKAKSGSVAA